MDDILLNPSLVGKELVSGGVAGTSGVFMGLPLDFVKTRCQLFPDIYKSPMHVVRATLAEEGILGFYKGMMSPLAAQFFVNALAFSGEALTHRLFTTYDRDNEWSRVAKGAIAGSVGGFLTCLVTVPTDLVKVRMQVDNLSKTPQFSSTMDCVRHVYTHDGGIRGFFRGMSVTIVREVPSFAAYFLCYDSLVGALTVKGEQPSTSSILFSGGCAGCASWAPIYPMDVIKTYIQNNPQDKRSAFSIATALYKQHGARHFGRGLGPVIVRAFPVNGVTFYVYEQCKRALGIERKHH